VVGPRKIRGSTYLHVVRRLAASSEAEQGLERGHGKSPPIVAKDEFIEVDLKLLATHAVIGPDQPLLHVPNCAVYQRYD